MGEDEKIATFFDMIQNFIKERKQILLEAFSTGTALKRADAANVFVYINRATGVINVTPIYDIIKYPKYQNLITVKPEISEIPMLKNEKETDIKKRLARNIMELRQFHLQVTYKASQDNSILDKN